MKPDACAVFLLLIGCICLHTVDCSLPDATPAMTLLQVSEKLNVVTSLRNKRLPGICRRLKRRRITVLCNLEKHCWRGRSQKTPVQVCRCPHGSKCSHFFVHSL